MRGLQELMLTEGTLCAVPDALTALHTLTLLSFKGGALPSTQALTRNALASRLALQPVA